MSVRVVHGIHDCIFDSQGQSVGAVRKSLRDVFNIPADAEALIGGRPVPEEWVLTDGEALEFMRDVGEKGLGALLSPAELREKWRLSESEFEELLVMGLPMVRFGSGVVRHAEAAVDEFFRQQGDSTRAKPPELVGTKYVADRLNCTQVWVTQMIRSQEIPPACVAPGTGDGKPWKLVRVRIDQWLERR